jgi:hypothetical protein
VKKDESFFHIRPSSQATAFAESENPKIQGFDGAVMSFVEYLHELAT